MGLFTLALGAVVLILNNVWSSGLQLLITIIGWLILIKGLFITILPSTAASFYKKFNKGWVLTLAGIVGLILGLALSFIVK